MFSVGQKVWHRNGQRSGTVLECEGDRVADIAKFARLGLAEPDAARDLAVVDVETRNDTFGQHRRYSTALAAVRQHRN